MTESSHRLSFPSYSFLDFLATCRSGFSVPPPRGFVSMDSGSPILVHATARQLFIMHGATAGSGCFLVLFRISCPARKRRQFAQKKIPGTPMLMDWLFCSLNPPPRAVSEAWYWRVASVRYLYFKSSHLNLPSRFSVLFVEGWCSSDARIAGATSLRRLLLPRNSLWRRARQRGGLQAAGGPCGNGPPEGLWLAAHCHVKRAKKNRL